jgi:ABC-type nickel/cobalt efflux system permease component RcnA
LLAISLVGARATVPQAFILATALTLAHTLGVLLFGVVVLTLARYIVPEALYPWIALLSGIFVAVLGARALARELSRRRSIATAPPVDRATAHAAAAARAFAQMSDHDHDGLDDEAHARAHMIAGTAPISFRSALVAASTGNVAPCPAALVVLLAAIATHRIGWGLVLIVAFSVGLALTLTLLGVAVVRGAAWLTQRPQFDRLARHAPLVTGIAISVIGAWMIGEGAVAQGLVATPIAVALIVLATIVAFIALETRRRAPQPRSVPA